MCVVGIRQYVRGSNEMYVCDRNAMRGCVGGEGGGGVGVQIDSPVLASMYWQYNKELPRTVRHCLAADKGCS